MNPKGVNDLDPKLKEAYDRIMGSSKNTGANQTPVTVNPPSGQNPPSGTTPQPPVMQTQTVDQNPSGQNPPSGSVTGGASAAPTMTQFQPPPVQVDKNAFSTTPDVPPVNVFSQNEPVSTHSQKKNISVSPMLFILGGAVFLTVYAVVWAKVFGLF